MVPVFNAVCISAAMTAIFVFRFGEDSTTRKTIGYFLLFFVAEWLGERYVVGEGGLGAEVGGVALVIAIVFTGASFVRAKLDTPGE